MARRAGTLDGSRGAAVLAAAIGVAMSLAAGGAAAQERSPRVPPALLPDIRLDRLPEASPRPAPELERPSTPAPAVPPATGAIRFVLRAVEIDGADAYPHERLAAAFAPLIGTPVTIADIYAAAREVERIYREDGYFLTRAIVPAQAVTDGRIRVRVLEGYVARVRLEGEPGAVGDLVERYLEPVTDERPLRLATLERALLLAGDIPGLAVSGVLQPARDELGAAELVVTVGRAPFGAAAVVDNYGDEFTGRWEAALGLTSNSWTPLGEQIGLIGFATDPWADRNQRVGQATTSWRLGGDGLTVETVTSYGTSRPGGDVRDFDIDSRTLLAGAALAHPVVRSRRLDVSVRLGFEWIDTETDVFETERLSRDRLRILVAGGESSFGDPLGGLDTLTVQLRQGLPVLDATRRSDASKSRPDGTGEATVVRGSLARLQPLAPDLALYTLVAGQYAAAPLLANEEFDLGGTRFGRGYDFDEISGDSGVGGTAELRWTLPIGLSWFDRAQLFGFIEGGRIWDRDDLGDDQLSSTGAGVRLFPTEDVLLELQVAQPLTLDSRRADGGREPQVLFRALGRL